MPAQVRVAVNVDRVTAGNKPLVSGLAVDAAGRPVAKAPVVIWEKAGGAPWRAAQRFTSGVDGRFSALLSPVIQSAYLVEVNGVRSERVDVSVHTRMELTKTSLSANRVATVTGTLTPKVAGFAVGLATYVQGKWVVLTSTRTDPTGGFTLTARVPAGSDMVVAFVSARPGLLKGSRSAAVPPR